MFSSKGRKKRKIDRASRKSDGWKRLSAYLKKGPLLLALIMVVFAAYYVGIRFRNYNGLKITDSLSESASERLLIDKEGVESTLYVFEAPIDDRILSAWIVIRNIKSGSSLVYYVPAGVYVRDFSGKLDDYVSVGDLRYAGDILNESRDMEYALWQIGNLTGLSVESYVWLNSDAISEYSSLFGDLSEFSAADYANQYVNDEDTGNTTYLLNSFAQRFSLLKLFVDLESWADLSSGIYSNLTTAQLINRVVSMKGMLNAGGVYLFDLSQPWATEQITTSNGKTANILNSSEVDNEFSKYIGVVRGREIEREQVKVEVYNASGIAGLASRYARKIRNSGMTVVRYENAPDEQEKTTLYVPKPSNYSNSLEIVKDILVVDTNQIEGRPSFITTGDIVVILGKDMGSEISWE